MSKSKLTKWFPADAKPAWRGVYEKDFGHPGKEYQYWNGSQWIYGDTTPTKTIKRIVEGSDGLDPFPRPWRGLAQDPKVKK